ncbi:MAG: hypothetical protein QF888_03130 [Desulfobacterales bacterium]|nr:hypothetical protein [Desulfobacterales bacterium]
MIATEIVQATMAMRGVAVLKSTILTRRGIATGASPNPKVERTKVARKRMLRTGKTYRLKSISEIKTFGRDVDDRPMLTMAFGFVKKYHLTKILGLNGK